MIKQWRVKHWSAGRCEYNSVLWFLGNDFSSAKALKAELKAVYVERDRLEALAKRLHSLSAGGSSDLASMKERRRQLRHELDLRTQQHGEATPTAHQQHGEATPTAQKHRQSFEVTAVITEVRKELQIWRFNGAFRFCRVDALLHLWCLQLL